MFKTTTGRAAAGAAPLQTEEDSLDKLRQEAKASEWSFFSYDKKMRGGLQKVASGAYGVVMQAKRRVGVGTEVYKIMLLADGAWLYDDNEMARSISEIVCRSYSVLREIIAADSLKSLDNKDNEVYAPGFVQHTAMRWFKGWDDQFYDTVFKKHKCFHEARDGSVLSAENKARLTTICITYPYKGVDYHTALNDKYFPTRPSRLSSLFQVALALHGAEMTIGYEHRDLHLGNVLVSPSKDNKRVYVFGDLTVVLKTCGREVNIIDQGFCRFEENGQVHASDVSYPNDGTTYDNVAVEYQDEDAPKEKETNRAMARYTERDWHAFVPGTNARWLWHLSRYVFSTNFPRSKMYTDALMKQDRDVFQRLFKAKTIGSWLNTAPAQRLLNVVASTSVAQ